MAQDDVIDLDPLISSLLQQSSAQTASTRQIPTAQPLVPMDQGSSFYDLYPLIGAGQAATPYDVLGPEDEFLYGQPRPKSRGELTQEAGILNEGIPTGLRFELSTTTLFNPELQKKNVEHNLRRYFEAENLITDDYDLGLRIGPVSQRLEFRDPRFDGKYNVVDPFGAKDILGDIADISMDTLLPIATEVTAGVGTAMIPGVGQVPGAPIAAAALAATATSFGRLKYAQNQGFLSEEITDEDIAMQALKEGGLSAAFGIGGQAAFKMLRPILRTMGLASPKMAFDIDEQTFIRAYEKYMSSPKGKAASEAGVTPSSAQILEAVAKQEASAVEKGKLQATATELAEQEARISTSPERDTADALVTPSLERSAAAEIAVRDVAEESMPTGVRGTAESLGEREAQALGENIQAGLTANKQMQLAQLDDVVSRELINVETAIDDAVNLPSNVADISTIGSAAKEAIVESYEKASAAIGKQYEDLFTRWSDSTGISIDSVVVGKGAIRPTEAVKFAQDLKATLPDRPFADPGDATVINKVLDSFVESTSGAATKIKPISLRTLNENIRDLRRLERKAYLAAQRGENAPSPETISGMVDALEKARNRIISRKDAPEGLAEELEVLDTAFADFSKKFRNAQVSAVAKLRNAKNPESAWGVLFQKDSRGKTAVLDIAEELKLPQNADLFADVGAAIRNKWLNTVVKRDSKGQITKIDIAAHSRFINEYGAVLDSYLTRAERNALGSAKEFAEQVINTQARKKATVDKINTKFDLGGGKDIEPEFIFQRSWKEGGISKFDEVYNVLRESPELLDTYKAFVYKDMFDPAAKRVKLVNGREVLDPAELKPYIDKNKDKLSTLFGPDYVRNLNTVLDVAEDALTAVPRRGARREGSALVGIIRGYVGMFTRPGRFLTFLNNQRGRMREDAMTMALADPAVLADMAKAAKVPLLSKEGQRLAGRILGGRYDDPTQKDLPVDRPSGARALLQELEAGNL